MAKKKKQSLREKREAEKKMRASKNYNIETVKENNRPSITCNSVKKASDSFLDKDIIQKESLPKKSTKSVGLKSVFALNNDEVIMTTFGNKSLAVLDKKIETDEIENLREDSKLKVEIVKNKNYYRVSNLANNEASLPQRPNLKRDDNSFVLKDDVIHCKSALEKRYFGKDFPDENIHIQIIYNILDIEKILSVHINNIVYCINNLFRDNGEDFIGTISLRNNLEGFKNWCEKKGSNKYERFENFLELPQLYYFGNAFYDSKTNNRKSKEEIYTILCLIGEIRQFLAHSTENNTRIFSIDKASDEALKNAYEEIKTLYNDRMSKIDSDFINLNCKSNFKILFNILDASSNEKKLDIISNFYNFNIKKEYKYLGISIKQIREILLDEAGLSHIKNKEYDAPRSKIYTALDFILYSLFVDNPDILNNYVDSLRNFSGSKDQKLIIYRKITDDLKYNFDFANKFVKAANFIEKDYAENKQDFEISDEDFINRIKEKISEITAIKEENNSPFPYLINVLTYFLDGKEINDLLTTLISKFKDIDCWIKVLNEANNKEKDCPIFDENSDYAMFNNCENIFSQLELLLSVARMQKPIEIPELEETMYIDAAKMLGIGGNDSRLSEEIKAIISSKNKDGNITSKLGSKNFIYSNVIKSSRFRYLARYTNPEKIRYFAKNKAIIIFVLNDIATNGSTGVDQIDRYYKSCNKGIIPYGTTLEEKITFLTDIIYNLSNSDFSKINKAQDATEFEKAQTAISLYLTVLYLIVKNLVYVNSRYFLAFHCFERDSALKGCESGYSSLVKDFIDQRKPYLMEKKRRAKDELHNKCVVKAIEKQEKYINHLKTSARLFNDTNNPFDSDNLLNYFTNFYRNNAAHLNAIRYAEKNIEDIKFIDSYFSLYHYLTQKNIYDSFKIMPEYNHGIKKPDINGKLKDCFDNIEKYKTYSKDLLKALNLTFGYNPARYNNLSYSGLFDKNRPKASPKN